MLSSSATSARVRKRSAAMVRIGSSRRGCPGDSLAPPPARTPSSTGASRRARRPCPDSGSMSGVELQSPPPRRVAKPRWLDLRLILGIVLVLAAVLLGAVVVSRARHTDRAVAVTRDLAAGTTLRAEDVHLVDAQLPDRDAYVGDTGDAIGKLLTRPLSEGELLPATALGAQPAATTVTI